MPEMKTKDTVNQTANTFVAWCNYCGNTFTFAESHSTERSIWCNTHYGWDEKLHLEVKCPSCKRLTLVPVLKYK